MDITAIKNELSLLTKELGDDLESPSLVCLDGESGIVELQFDDAYDKLSGELQQSILSYYLKGLRKQFDYIVEVKLFSIEGKKDEIE